MEFVAFKVLGLMLIIRVLMSVFNWVPKVLFTSSLRFANCEGNLAFRAATLHFLAICSCGGRQRTFWESAENKQEQAGELFKSSTYQREMLSYLHAEGNKSGPETLIYWVCGGSWWSQFLLDRLLMSGSTAAMQVFIFCYKNYAKSTGADAIKDRTALEGSHQMLSCSVTHAASGPNSSFSRAQHSWFRMDLVLIFPLTQQSCTVRTKSL